jgi:hypothetical protein
MKRHFEPGLTSRSPRERYLIDRTSCDGDGLVPDDGNQHREGHPDNSAENLLNVDSRAPGGLRGG